MDDLTVVWHWQSADPHQSTVVHSTSQVSELKIAASSPPVAAITLLEYCTLVMIRFKCQWFVYGFARVFRLTFGGAKRGTGLNPNTLIRRIGATKAEAETFKMKTKRGFKVWWGVSLLFTSVEASSLDFYWSTAGHANCRVRSLSDVQL